MRIHRHITDLAGSGLVLIALLLGAMVISAVPVIVQSLAGRGAAATAHGPTVNAPSDRAAS
jgi:hypothetical protein